MIGDLQKLTKLAFFKITIIDQKNETSKNVFNNKLLVKEHILRHNNVKKLEDIILSRNIFI